ncbi:MAG TPA: hypothetical protein VLA56_11000 [Pseudomonadales bacterium]|nr:hypothetical protein [Pseudomonadales bacterium]
MGPILKNLFMLHFIDLNPSARAYEMIFEQKVDTEAGKALNTEQELDAESNEQN